jgi:hypothetical protein
MKLAVVGSRTFENYELLCALLGEQWYQHGKKLIIVTGGATGADSLAEKWAKDNGIEVKVFLPDWDKFGKQAGFLRNTTIVNECDQLLAFWDRKSKGTLDSIKKAIQMKKFVMIQGF